MLDSNLKQGFFRISLLTALYLHTSCFAEIGHHCSTTNKGIPIGILSQQSSLGLPYWEYSNPLCKSKYITALLLISLSKGTL